MTLRLWGECLGCDEVYCDGCGIWEQHKRSTEDMKGNYAGKSHVHQDKTKEIRRSAVDMKDALEQLEDYLKDECAGGSTPSQYGIPNGATDLQDLIEYRNMDFATGNIFKACYRLGTKNDDLYEVNKILWFAERLKARLEGTDTGRNK